MSATDALIMLVSGPNLDLLGDRQPEIYGTRTLDDLVESATREASGLSLKVRHVQSNHEGEIVEVLHEARREASGIVINAGAFSHYSWAIHDALACFEGPIIELHLSNPGSREQFRQQSVITPVATAVISGLGPAGYPLAMRAMAGLLDPQR